MRIWYHISDAANIKGLSILSEINGFHKSGKCAPIFADI